MGNPYRRYVSRFAADWGEADTSWRSVDGTVLFVDISGFTALSERLAAKGRIGAEELTGVLGRVFGSMLDAVYARGGSLLKFGGDALCLVFDSKDHVMQATAAAVEMRAALREAAKEPTSVGRISLKMSSGIHTGPIDLFLVGHSHRELIVAGPTMSTTAVMEAVADAGQIVVSPEMAERLPSGFVGDEKGRGLLLRKRRIHHPLPTGTPTSSFDPDALAGLVPASLREVIGAGVVDSEHRVATIGFLGFTGTDSTIARSGHERAAESIDKLVTAVQGAADQEGITFLASDVAADGGKLILASGVPVVQGDDEGRLLRAARQILDSDQDLNIRIGLNRGHVFAGAVGTERRATYTVMGDTVNLAARLMTAAPPGALYAHPSVLDRSSSLFQTRALERFSVKGKTETVEAYEVGEETGSRSIEATDELVFTGREDELKRLSELIQETGTTLTLTGDSGIGKTRLINEALALNPSVATFTAQSEPSRSESPYWAFRDSMRDLLGIEIGPQASMRATLKKALKTTAPELAPYVPLIGDVAQIDIADTPETTDLDSRFRPSKTAEVLTTLIERLTEGPLAIIFEDAHWMDELSLGLMAHLSLEAERRPWTVVVTDRAGENGFDPIGDEIPLGPLSDDDIRAIAVVATEAAPLRPHELEAIVARASGNPLFLGEILRVVRESGNADELPETLDAVVSADIDRLAPLTRQLLRYASVLGQSFETIIFDRILEPEGITLDEATRDDLARFIDTVNGDRYRFRLSVVHSAAYQGLSYRRRRELHARAGEVIEDLAGDDLDSAADALAFHFSNSGNHQKAWRYSRTAAARSKHAYANSQAAVHYETAIEAARNLKEVKAGDLARIWSDLGDVRDLVGEYESAREAFSRALRVGELDPVVEADLYLKRAHSWYGQGAISRAKRNVTLGTSRLGNVNDLEYRKARARLDAYRSSLEAESGDPGAARETASRAARMASETGENLALARAYTVLDWANFVMGVDEPRRGGEAVEFYEEMGSLEKAVNVLSNLGAFAYLEGDWNQAANWYEKSIDVAERTGHVAEGGAAHVKANLAEVLVSQRRFPEAIALLEESERVFTASNAEQALPFVRLQAARAATGQGRADEAIEILGPMLSNQLEEDESEEAPETAVYLAEAQVAAGLPVEALRTIDLLELETEDDIDAVPPSIARTRALALRQSGQEKEAQRYLNLALDQARGQGDLFEEALALEALADPAHEDRRSELFASLGIVG